MRELLCGSKLDRLQENEIRDWRGALRISVGHWVYARNEEMSRPGIESAKPTLSCSLDGDVCDCKVRLRLLREFFALYTRTVVTVCPLDIRRSAGTCQLASS